MTVAGGNGKGSELNKLNAVDGICIDDDQTLYIVDCGLNSRIIEWKRNINNGRVAFDKYQDGNRLNQLGFVTDIVFDEERNSFIITDRRNRKVIQWFRYKATTPQVLISDIDCYGIALDKDGSIYVSDELKNEIKRWKQGDKEGIVVAGGNGQGSQLNQFNHPTYIFIDDEYSLYVSDKYNHRVVKWLKDAKEGIIVAGGNEEGDSLSQLSHPHGVIVDPLGRIYIADSYNHRIIRWSEKAKNGSIVVWGNGPGSGTNQLYYPNNLAFDREGNLYVADELNYRVQKFKIISR